MRYLMMIATLGLVGCTSAPTQRFDVVVIGGTPSGCAAAVRAAREGLSVLLVERTGHLGGMLTNGLGQWDALTDTLRSPLFNETALGIEDHYRRAYGEKSPQFRSARYTRTHYPVGRFEPRVAEAVVTKLVAGEPRITRLDGFIPVKVDRDGATVRSVTLHRYPGGSERITAGAGTFIDATYEGDLAALAGAPYRVGREGRDEYNEPHAGKAFTNMANGPAPRDAVEGKLNIVPYRLRQGSIDPASPFTADRAVQAYNFRLFLSSNPANRVIPQRPANYRREDYINFDRKGMGAGGINAKGTFNSPLIVGGNHDYPEADWPAREKIIQRHRDFALGLMHFLQNDESVKPATRAKYRQIGLAADEFTDNGHIPYEMYVREARRIVGRYVHTEHDNMLAPDGARTPVHRDSIAITDWFMDSHDCTTERRPGYAHEGKLILTEESRPAQVPYRCLLPRGIDNLLVPVCLSATHVAWGAVRLEPVLMQTGEAAGFAAAIAKRRGVSAANIDSGELVRTLVDSGFIVTFINEADTHAPQPWLKAAQYLGTRGLLDSYAARPDDKVTPQDAAAWSKLVPVPPAAANAPTRGQAFIQIYETLTKAKP